MDSCRLHSPSPFLTSFYFLFLVTFVGIPVSLCDDDHIDPSSCSKMFNCGEIKNIGFPFWEDTRPSNCGSPGLKLHCEGSSVTTIEIMNVTYRVLDVNPKTQILKISRDGFLDWNLFAAAGIGEYHSRPHTFRFEPRLPEYYISLRLSLFFLVTYCSPWTLHLPGHKWGSARGVGSSWA
jgi:hypothetical protein